MNLNARSNLYLFNNGDSSNKKIKQPNKDIKALWDKFDEEIGDKKMECVYNNVRTTDECSTCKSALAFTDEGFLACTNINVE